MTVKLTNTQQVFQEAIEILFTHLTPSKMTLLLANWQHDESNYLKIKDKLFENQTIEDIYRQAKALEENL